MNKKFNKNFNSKKEDQTKPDQTNNINKLTDQVSEDILNSSDAKATVNVTPQQARNNDATVDVVTEELLSSLAATDMNVGDQSPTLTANVNNLYNAEGYTGLKYIGDEIKPEKEDNEANATLMQTDFWTWMAQTDVVNVKDIDKEMAGVSFLRDSLKFKPQAFFSIIRHNPFGIQSLLKDDTVLTKQFITQIVNMLGRGQAEAFTESEVLAFDEVTATIDSQQVKIPAVVLLWWYETHIGIGIDNFQRVLKNFKSFVYSISQTSIKAKEYADTVISEWERSYNQTKISKFLNSLSMFSYHKAYNQEIYTSFASNFKRRTGRIAPQFTTIVLSSLRDEDNVEIRFSKETILRRDFVQDFIKALNSLAVMLMCIAYRIPVNDVKKTYGDLLDVSMLNFDGIPTVTYFINGLATVEVAAVTYFNSLSAYYKFRTVLQKAGFVRGLEKFDYSTADDFTKGNRPSAMFMCLLSSAIMTSFSFGVRITAFLDLNTVGSFIGNGRLAALAKETAVDRPDVILHYPIVETPREVYGITSYYGYYIMTLNNRVSVSGVQMPLLKVCAFDPDRSSSYKEVPLVDGSLITKEFTLLSPIYAYNRKGSPFKGVYISQFYEGEISQLVPSLSKELLNYLIENNIG